MPSRKKKQAKSKNIYSQIRREFGNENYGLAQFRKDITRLRRAGLVSSRIDIGKVLPTEYLTRVIRQFRDVILEQAQTIEIPRGERAAYKTAGYRTKGKRAVIPTREGERVERMEPEGTVPRFKIILESATGRRETESRLVPYNQLEKYVIDLVNHAPPLKKGEFYGFRFFGNRSRMTFENDLGDRGKSAKNRLLEYFLRYPSVDSAMRSEDGQDIEEIYMNFEVVKLDRYKMNQWGIEAYQTRTELSKARAKERGRRAYENRKRAYAQMSPEEQWIYRQKTAGDKAARAARDRTRYLAKKAAKK